MLPIGIGTQIKSPILILLSIPDENRRERAFYKARNLPNPKDLPQNIEDETFDRTNDSHVETDYHRQDEQVNVCLECISTNLNSLKRKFIRCSSQATITHLKKFVAKKVLNGMEKYKEVSSIYFYTFCWEEAFQFICANHFVLLATADTIHSLINFRNLH